MKRGALPLNALRALESAARLGGMSRAADELGVTYGAVSRQVRMLEARLGVTLFEGPRNRPRPSATALRLLPALTAAFDGIEAAVARAAVRPEGPVVLDISCLGTLTMRWLIPRLYGFRAAHPGIELRLTENDGPVAFRAQGPDVAIRVGGTRPADWPGARIAHLFPDRTGPVLSPALMPAGGLRSPAALASLPWLHTRSRPRAWHDWIAASGAPLTADPASLAEATAGYEHFYFLLEAAVTGLGVAAAPEILVRDDIASGRLIAPFGFCPTGRNYVLLTPDPPGPEAEAFGAWLLDLVTREDMAENTAEVTAPPT
ncbi:LysR family transcriptional regulator [Mesobaculum littorinae]|uniref:LysR family transcriptional regulator n=1 Tax=Mesobaculum littorinae TaxID=2486419 RepID=A0A438AE14_9RHOB|nr:LysR substrate-binding domain-containing protein [Mesobaculum littorinae]RVV96898.1 LysR family transcriptional regulator [Mesobaculum littorinae]